MTLFGWMPGVWELTIVLALLVGLLVAIRFITFLVSPPNRYVAPTDLPIAKRSQAAPKQDDGGVREAVLVPDAAKFRPNGGEPRESTKPEGTSNLGGEGISGDYLPTHGRDNIAVAHGATLGNMKRTQHVPDDPDGMAALTVEKQELSLQAESEQGQEAIIVAEIPSDATRQEEKVGKPTSTTETKGSPNQQNIDKKGTFPAPADRDDKAGDSGPSWVLWVSIAATLLLLLGGILLGGLYPPVHNQDQAVSSPEEVPPSQHTEEETQERQVLTTDEADDTLASLRAGFRGVQWGRDIGDCPGMVLAADWGKEHESLQGLRVYERAGESLTYGQAKLTAVGYVFYKSQFATADVASHGRENWLNLRDAVFAEYGQGHNPDKSVDRWEWHTDDIWVTLRYDPLTSEARLRLTYRPIAREYVAENSPPTQQIVREAPRPSRLDEPGVEPARRSTIAADTRNRPEWQRVTVTDVGTIDIPPEMEVQRQVLGQLNPFNDGETQKLTIQQAGWNQLDPRAAELYFRLTVSTEKLTPGSVSMLGSEIPLNAAELKKLSDDPFSELPTKWRESIITTYPAEVVRLGTSPAIQTGYKRKGAFSDGPVLVTRYVIPNYDRRHILTVAYRESEAEIWTKFLPRVLSSLKITNVRKPVSH